MPISTILVFLSLFLLYLLTFFANRVAKSKKLKGKIGEVLTEEALDRFEKYNKDIYGKTLRNVYVPKSDIETSEIDVVYVTARGIFVVESKNYSGWIFGSEKDQYWTASLPAGKGKSIKNKFYNPLKQNDSHIKYLRGYLKQLYPGKDFKIFSLIVFSERCKLKSIPQSSSHIIIQRNNLYKTIKDIVKREELSLTNEQVDEIYGKLEGLTKVDKETKQAHIDNIKENYISSKVLTNKSEDLVCPLCGNKLVMRTAKRGDRAGKRFYGCSGYPKCGYTKNIDE